VWQIRYPDATIYLTKDELETSVQIAEFFREFMINSMGLTNKET
jgi:hypothetical protein